MPNQTKPHKHYTRERKFVDTAKKVADASKDGELTLFSYHSYTTLLRFAKRCKAGDLEARKLWDELPEKVRDFWPALNYLNLGKGE
jgi:hypothetical protein